VLAFGERRPLLDPNVVRVLDRVLGRRSTLARPRTDRSLWESLAELLPRSRPRDFGLALIDLGALVCRPRRPRCADCPLRRRCRAYASGSVTPV
jgi:A/G-specific adenine glycosylase